ncbi:MT-A70 family protein [Oxytricha trifallax]|uniref:mRNA m(6)A methyltransferase n=1 Tax=Oxytricha trifallax TaxID=1172189 RepID=A0A073HZZ8_9SPIT|nr:MT-A70 family protein [Oxytricha trifallax]
MCMNEKKQMKQKYLEQCHYYELKIATLIDQIRSYEDLITILNDQFGERFRKIVEQVINEFSEDEIKKIQNQDQELDQEEDLDLSDSQQYQNQNKRALIKTEDIVENLVLKEKEYQLKFFKWGMRQIKNGSVQYQGSIQNPEVWNQIKKDYKVDKCGNRFDVLLSNGPWDQTACNLNYPTLKDREFLDKIPLEDLQKDGYYFMWITNKKLEAALKHLDDHNYERVEIITWIKIDKKQIIREGIGYFLRHCYEFCIMARNKGPFSCLRQKSKTHSAPNVIFAELREQSRKPDQIYQIIEQLVPGGRYLELFPRPHNQRVKWTGLGKESILKKKVRTQLRRQQRDKIFNQQIQMPRQSQLAEVIFYNNNFFGLIFHQFKYSLQLRQGVLSSVIKVQNKTNWYFYNIYKGQIQFYLNVLIYDHNQDLSKLVVFIHNILKLIYYQNRINEIE